MSKRAIQPYSHENQTINIASGKPMFREEIPAICLRIRLYRERKHMDQSALAKALGITSNAISNWETGRSRPDINLLPRICEILNVSLYELFAVEDPSKRFTASEETLISNYRSLKPAYRHALDGVIESFLEAQEMEQCRELTKLTLYDQTLAAGVSFGTEFHDPGTPLYAYSDEIDHRADCVFTISGDSMEPTFHDGDLVLVERLNQAEAMHYGDIGAFADGNDLWIKEYRPDGLYSHNSHYPPMIFAEDTQIALIGRVVGTLHPGQIASREDVDRFHRFHKNA